ncbi:unnamed protein product [Spirodela intermedia]|uniref:Uncharacterized protein n=1 Tax=Spirodela intermedia TaxID=51605 RepID=A0A7I8LNZ7_SPIIN|nr:unnamed protein product [Spirodela intermedia]
MAAASTSTSASLKEYLKRYETGGEEQKKKKKKKKGAKSAAPGGVLIVDEDPVWAKPVIPDAEEESEAEETPVVDEDVEVKRLRRLEELRSRKPFHSISEDGSGWISVSNAPKLSSSGGEVPDLSPPRQRRARFDTPSPDRSEMKVSSARSDDLSPPRQRRRHYDSPSPEPLAKPSISGSKGVTPDMSPPRRRKPDEDISPPRRGIRPPVSDLSPLRRRKNLPEGSSPPRRKKDASENLSPPRRSRNRSPEVPSSLRRVTKGLPDDLSPPRKGRRAPQEDLSPTRDRRVSPEDLSPPRREKKGLREDLSPPRRAQRHLQESKRPPDSTETDLSPPRRKKNDLAEGLSPPRRGGRLPESDYSLPREIGKKHMSTKEERRAGLFTGREMKEEIDRKKKEEASRFAALDPGLSGRGAEPVYRDKEGKRISKEEMLKLQKGEEKAKEKKLEWGKGLAQKREAESRIAELELEKEKPFARSRDDPELDKMLRERTRWGDPMAHLVKKKQSETLLEDLGDDERMKESGFIIPQTIPIHSWLKRGVDPPANRYGIRPGRHWDGVDRSNGFEKQMFKRQSEKRATETEAYLWSVSDM